MLAYVKALSCEEGNLVKKSASVYLPRAEGEAGVEENVNSTGDVESSLIFDFILCKNSFWCVVVFEILKKEFPT